MGDIRQIIMGDTRLIMGDIRLKIIILIKVNIIMVIKLMEQMVCFRIMGLKNIRLIMVIS